MRTVIIDVDIPQLENNKFFDRELANKVSHTILPWCYLAEQAKEQGIQMITSDVYLQDPASYPDALLISHMITARTEALIAAGAKPLLLISQESPIIAYRFYFLLKRHSARYPHTMLPEGYRHKVSPRTTFHTLRFAEPYEQDVRVHSNWENKQFLTMISGNKRAPLTLKRVIAGIISGKFYRELYKERLEVVQYFSDKGLDLYGMGWGKEMPGESPELRASINACYRGPVDDKIETLRGYKFTFTFENTIAPGYVTEKIFDAIFAGSVPVYLGAPDIKQFVHPEAFIDMRDFKNYSELERYLREMSQERYEQYIQAMNTYIQSPEYAKFSQKEFAKQMIELIENT